MENFKEKLLLQQIKDMKEFIESPKFNELNKREQKQMMDEFVLKKLRYSLLYK